VLSAILRAHHVPIAVEELSFLLGVTGWALVWGGLTWLVYLSLEPFLRRVWPKTLISWTRLLSGQARDPLVGRDVLIGMCAGVIEATLVIARLRIGGHAAPSDTLYTALESLESIPHFANIAFVYQLANSLQGVLIGSFLVLLLRLIVRKTWIAVGIAVIAGLPFMPGGGAPAGWELLFVMAALLVMISVFLRVGLLAQLAMVFTDLLVRVPITLDTDSWYFGQSLVVLLVLGALATYGFLVSLGGRPAFGTTA
jgi:serine/threonine-protein kinase